MAVPSVTFNNADQPEFFKELRSRVNQHFKEKNISKYANLSMVLKTTFMLSLYFVPYILMLTGVFTSVSGVLVLWTIMGFGMAGIGLTIMHDANHGSYSRRKSINGALGFTLNFIGGYHINWKIQHNVLHHTFTNIDGYDDDIDKPIMRYSPIQRRRWMYYFQVIYAPILYGMMTIYWFLSKDFEQLFRYDKMDLLEGQGVTLKKGLLIVAFHKLWYAILFIGLPMLLVPIPWYFIILGFVMMQVICGLILALIFQPAHVVEATEFYKPDASGSVENNWAIHQMLTTSNYANGSSIFSWFVGGLNNQIEHHLFPNICHVHYRGISGIVKTTAEEYGLPYNQHRTFFGALISHFTLLNKLGTGKHDSDLALSLIHI